MRLSDDLFKVMMRNIHAYIVLVERDFTVAYTNYYDLTETACSVKPKRVGDLLQCSNALSAPHGCGTHRLCGSCPLRCAIEHCFQTQGHFSNLEVKLRIRESDGEVMMHDVDVAGEFMMVEGRECMLITVHDITHLKQVEEELKQANRRAEEADKAKSAFLANMSHEIRTPLNAIVGFSELLATASTEEEKKMYLDIVRSNNEMLQQLVADILDLSKIEAGMLELVNTEVDLNLLFCELEQQFRIRMTDIGSQVDLSVRIPEENTLLYIDRNRLVQVMGNLLNNAIKFTEKGSIVFGYEPEEECIRFYVKDSGPGIAPENQQAVFQRFVRLEQQKTGTGLGLSISRSIVRKLGGDIGVESEEGKGALFWFTLPYSKKP